LPNFADARAEARSTLAVAPTKATLWFARSGIVVASVLLNYLATGERGLWSADEGRAAQCAQNILESGDWSLPRLHTGAVEMRSPPMYPWLAAVSARVFGGVDGWSVRLPSFIAATAALLVVFEFGVAVGGLTVGLASATILACTTRFAWLARVARPEMALAAAVVGCLFLFWRARVAEPAAGRGVRLPFTFYGLLSIAILLRGPVALALIATPLLLWVIAVRRPLIPVLHRAAWMEWRELRLLPGLAIATAATVSWFAYADLRTDGAFTRAFFLSQLPGRGLEVEETASTSPWWTYLPRFFGDFFPWSLLLPAAGLHLWKTRSEWLRTKDRSTIVFLLAWAVGQIVLLTALPTKRADYLLPIYPAAALLAAYWLNERRRRFFHRRETTVARDYRGRSRTIVATACLLAAAAAPFLYWGERQFTRKGGLVKGLLTAAVLDRHFNDTDEFMLLRVESTLREQWPLIAILLPTLLASIWLLHTGWHDRLTGRMVAGLAAPWALCFLIQVQVVMSRLDGLRDMERFAQTIRHLAGEGRTIYYFDDLDADLVFHAGKPARVVESWFELDELARYPTPVFVVARTDRWQVKKTRETSAGWCEIANNCQFARHREPRTFLTNRPDEVADRLHIDRDSFMR